MSAAQEFVTTDLYVAAYLMTVGGSFQRTVPTEGYSRRRECWAFAFADAAACCRMADDYANGRSVVNAKRYVESIRRLQGIIRGLELP